MIINQKLSTTTITNGYIYQRIFNMAICRHQDVAITVYIADKKNISFFAASIWMKYVCVVLGFVILGNHQSSRGCISAQRISKD